MFDADYKTSAAIGLFGLMAGAYLRGKYEGGKVSADVGAEAGYDGDE